MPIAPRDTHAAISGRSPSFAIAASTNAFTPALSEPSYVRFPGSDKAAAACAAAPIMRLRRPTLSWKSALPSLIFCDLIAVFASLAT